MPINDRKDSGFGSGRGEVKTCARCRRIFTYLGFGHFYCPQCKKLDEEDFEKVRDYIYGHGVASALEVSDNTGVSVRHIEIFIREGRLEIPESSPIFIKCEMCKTDIRSGRICANCSMRLSATMKIDMEIDEYQIGETPKKSGKMRFLNHDRWD